MLLAIWTAVITIAVLVLHRGTLEADTLGSIGTGLLCVKQLETVLTS